ncbi:hypothetical protein NFI95_07855 [Acetobacteraceae bacterium KSS8]|uniref:Uncharacterized protein n=1 Tax=Endosaccharibacter trunci TaxID=2812733 RepID=A0ABT1W675_9PROT|nr:hypothetical protein [Acetobacteraceae bacterium KSS8]
MQITALPPAFRPAVRAIAVTLLAGAVMSAAGCKLIDQRTFDPDVNRKPVPVMPPAPPAPKPVPPLARVQFAAPPESWKPGLTAIVREALARKPDALFTVQTVVPAVGTTEQQAAAMEKAVHDGGQAVAQTIQDAGATTAQINMAATTDAVTAPEVRVTVR